MASELIKFLCHLRPCLGADALVFWLIRCDSPAGLWGSTTSSFEWRQITGESISEPTRSEFSAFEPR